MSGPRAFFCLLGALVWCGLVDAGALEVRQVWWGFEGRVVPARFNPLSVLVANPGNTAFDGPLSLVPTLGFGGARGAAYVQPVFIGPQSARWVQFEVMIGAGAEEYALVWGRGPKERETFDRQLPTGPPACVRLLDESDAFAQPGAFKAFPDQLFPTTVAATDGLDAVILDYVPRWEPARREAFLDWLQRGGTVHLLPGANGEPPVFGDTLAVLNGPAETTRVGAGQVVRHAVPRADLTEKILTTRGFPPRELKQPKDPAIYNLEETFYQRLASLTRPKVSWWLLNSLTFLYIALIGPVAWRLARRWDFRWTIAGFLGVVTLFGVAFSVIGRRGYGESQTVHSLSIARALGGARWDVTQWLSAFATSSGQYTLTHAAPVNLYATSLTDDAARGQILSGKDGKFLADIPLYSSRVFAHRAVMQGDDLGLTVETWETTAAGPGSPARQLKMLVLKTGPGFPGDVLDVAVRFGERIYALTKTGDRYVLTPDGGALLGDRFGRDKLQQLGNSGLFVDDRAPAEARLREMLPLLQARALGVGDILPQFSERPPAANQLQFLIAARSPAGFHMRGQGFGHENGIVLYVQDIFPP